MLQVRPVTLVRFTPTQAQAIAALMPQLDLWSRCVGPARLMRIDLLTALKRKGEFPSFTRGAASLPERGWQISPFTADQTDLYNAVMAYRWTGWLDAGYALILGTERIEDLTNRLNEGTAAEEARDVNGQ